MNTVLMNKYKIVKSSRLTLINRDGLVFRFRDTHFNFLNIPVSSFILFIFDVNRSVYAVFV